MPETVLTQPEADALVAVEKHRENDDEWQFPEVGSSITAPLVSADRREKFLLDVSRGRIRLSQAKYQNRAYVSIVLRRLELDGPRHQNPDGEWVACPHMHVYRENFGDKWAIPLRTEEFPNQGDIWKVLEDFVKHCNITRPPRIIRGLLP